LLEQIVDTAVNATAACLLVSDRDASTAAA
jgi:hypothetical protein